MRFISILLATGLFATATLSPALAGSRTAAVNACKAHITETVEGENVKMSLGRVDQDGKSARFTFKIRYTDEAGERVKVKADCIATRQGEVLGLEGI